MKASQLRIYTGDIRPYLRSDRLETSAGEIGWRGWLAWESFPQDAGSVPIRLVARATLKDGQASIQWLVSSPAEFLKHALQKMLDCLRWIGAGWGIRKPG